MKKKSENKTNSKKPFYKRKWFIGFAIFFVLVGILGDNEDENTSTTTQVESTETNIQEDSEKTTQEVESLELTPEEQIISTLSKNDIEVEEIDLTSLSDDGEEVVITVLLENDEDLVNSKLPIIRDTIYKNSPIKHITLLVKDASGKLESNMAIIYLNTDESIEIVYEHPNYLTTHTIWVQSQFSAWDGSHKELVNLVKSSMNDEKSFEHINTTYRIIGSESVMNDVNSALQTDGYDQRVKLDDILIIMEFSGKNAFNATMKNTAVGIADYENNTINVVGIGS